MWFMDDSVRTCISINKEAWYGLYAVYSLQARADIKSAGVDISIIIDFESNFSHCGVNDA